MLKGIFSRAYSRLFIIGDNSGWSIDVDARDLKSFADKLGVQADIAKKMYWNLPQAVHYTSQFSLQFDIYKSKNRLSVDYYHGKPEQQESFRKCFEGLKNHHQQFGAVRVSNSEMKDLILSSGIAPEKVMLIHIGIDTEIFKPRNSSGKKLAREKLGIPQDAVVVGSFQKDGVGWGEGMEPKLIKGPDTFLQVLEVLKREIPNLYVLLSGPSRGYVKSGLEKMATPYKHHFFKDYREISELYDALDFYLVTSREEGGPKAVLESMAKGVPLITTEVGQAKDLVKSGVNAMMAPIEATVELSEHCLKVLRDESLRNRLIEEGLKTAKENSLESQLPLWKTYLEKLVDS